MVSQLIIHGDIEYLRDLAHRTAGEYNIADVFWLKGERPGSIQVAETLGFIERAHLSPVGERKLFIIMDAATMTVAAQNKLLKTIEDAPASTDFLLLATSIEPILNTIRSRCVTRFSPQPSGGGPLVPPDVSATLKSLFKTEINEQSLSYGERFDIMKTRAEINKRVAANCNAQNQQDLLIMEILKKRN